MKKKNGFLLIAMMLVIFVVNAQTTYNWVGGSSGDYQVAANWASTAVTPAPRTTPASTDILQFSSSATVTNVPDQSIGQLILSGTTTVVSLQPAVGNGNRTLTIGNTTTSDDDLQIPSGCELIIAANSHGTIAIPGAYASGANDRDKISNGLVLTYAGSNTPKGNIAGKLTIERNATYTLPSTPTLLTASATFAVGAYVYLNLNVYAVTAITTGITANNTTVPTNSFGTTAVNGGVTLTYIGSTTTGSITALTQYGVFTNQYTITTNSVTTVASTGTIENKSNSIGGTINSSSLIFADGSNYIHNRADGSGAIPNGTSMSGVNLTVQGIFSSSVTITVTLPNSIKTLTWNTPNITGGTSTRFSIASGSTLNITGDVSLTNGTTSTSFGPSSGTITVNIGGNLTVTNCNLYIARGATTWAVTGNLILNSGNIDILSTLYASAPAITANLTVNGDVNVNNSAVLRLNCLAASSGALGACTANLNVKGSLSVAATAQLNAGTAFVPSQASNIVFNGTSAQLFTYSGGFSNNPNLIINNSKGVTITASTNKQLAINNLTLTSGNLFTSSSYPLFLNGTYTGGSNTSYVAGHIRKSSSSTSAFTLPTGSGGAFRPITITPQAATAVTFQVNPANVPSGSISGGVLDRISNHAVRVSTGSSITARVKVDYSYASGSITSTSHLILASNTANSGTWTALSGSPTITGSTTAGSIDYASTDLTIPSGSDLYVVIASNNAATDLIPRTSHTWTGAAGTTDYQTPNNWTPNRATASTTYQTLNFTSSATITNVPSQTIGQLILSGSGTVVSLSPAVGNGTRTLTIGNTTTSDDDLQVPSGTELIIAANSYGTIAIPAAYASGTNDRDKISNALSVAFTASNTPKANIAGKLTIERNATYTLPTTPSALTANTTYAVGDYVFRNLSVYAVTAVTGDAKSSADVSTVTSATFGTGTANGNATFTYIGSSITGVVNGFSQYGVFNNQYTTTNAVTSVSSTGTIENKSNSIGGQSLTSLLFANGSNYIYNREDGQGAIPTSADMSGVNLTVKGIVTSTIGVTAYVPPALKTLTWNTPNITGSVAPRFAVSTGTTLTTTGDVSFSLGGTTGTIGPLSGNPTTVNIGGNLTLTTTSFFMGRGTADWTVGGNLTMNTSGSLNVLDGAYTGSSPITSNLTVNGNFTINGTNTVRLNNLGAASGSLGACTANLTVKGNFTKVTGSTFNTSTGAGQVGNLVLNGTSAQTVDASGGFSNSPNLTINNSNGVTINNGPISVGTLTLTSGIVTSDTTIIVTNTATSGITGGSATAYINGMLQRRLPQSLAAGSTYVFPIGKSGSYNPVELIDPTTTSSTNLTEVRAEAIPSNAGGSGNSGNYVLNTNRYWTLTKPVNSSSFTNSKLRFTDAGYGSAIIVVTGLTPSSTAYLSLGGANINSPVNTVSSSTASTLAFANFALASLTTDYTWTGTTNNDFQEATNWSPNRTSSTAEDILRFTSSPSGIISNVPTQTIAQLILSGSSTVVSLQPATGYVSGVNANRTLSIGNTTSSDNDLQIPVGCELKIAANSFGTIAIPSSYTVGVNDRDKISNGLTIILTGSSPKANIAGKLTIERNATFTLPSTPTALAASTAYALGTYVFSSQNVYAVTTAGTTANTTTIPAAIFGTTATNGTAVLTYLGSVISGSFTSGSQYGGFTNSYNVLNGITTVAATGTIENKSIIIENVSNTRLLFTNGSNYIFNRPDGISNFPTAADMSGVNLSILGIVSSSYTPSLSLPASIKTLTWNTPSITGAASTRFAVATGTSLTISGNASITNGSTTGTLGPNTGSPSTVSIGGNLSITSTRLYTGRGTADWTVTGNLTFNSGVLTILDGGLYAASATPAVAVTSNLTVNGNVTMGSGSTINLSTVGNAVVGVLGASTANLNVKGNFTKVSGSTFSTTTSTGQTGNLVMNGTTAQTINATGGFTNSPSLIINNPSGVTLTGAAVTIGSLTLTSGTLTTSNNLTVTGASLVNNTTLNVNNTLTLSGTVAQTISGTTTVPNLTINNAAGVTLSSGANKLNITGTLTLQAGAFTTNGNVVLKSTSIANSAVVAPVGISGNTGTISGTVQVERFIPKAYRAWRDMAPSVFNAGSIYNNWQEAGSYANSGYGLFITGTTAATNAHAVDATTGLDQTVNSVKSAYTFTNGTWTAVTNTKTTNLNPFLGYRVLVRGDRTYDLFNTPISTVGTTGFLLMVNPTTIRATGNLVTGNVVYSTSGITNAVAGATYNSASFGLNSSSTTGFSSVANPYVAPIDWKNIWDNNRAVNLTANYYYLDPTIGSTGAYVSYNALLDVTSNGAIGSRRYIQAGQAFFVENNSSTSPSLTITEADKAISSTKTSVFGNASRSRLTIGLMKATGSELKQMDGATVVFDPSFSNGIGREDARKMTNPSENLAIIHDGQSLSIEGRKPAIADERLPLSLSQLASSDYQLTVDASAYQADNLEVYLIDALDKSETSLTSGKNTISFTVDASNPATYTNRFSVVFKAASKVTTVEPIVASTLSVYPNPLVGKTISVRLGSEAALGKYVVNVYNSLGQQVHSGVYNYAGSVISCKLPEALAKGGYQLTVVQEGKVKGESKFIVE